MATVEVTNRMSAHLSKLASADSIEDKYNPSADNGPSSRQNAHPNSALSKFCGMDPKLASFVNHLPEEQRQAMEQQLQLKLAMQAQLRNQFTQQAAPSTPRLVLGGK